MNWILYLEGFYPKRTPKNAFFIVNRTLIIMPFNLPTLNAIQTKKILSAYDSLSLDTLYF